MPHPSPPPHPRPPTPFLGDCILQFCFGNHLFLPANKKKCLVFFIVCKPLMKAKELREQTGQICTFDVYLSI